MPDEILHNFNSFCEETQVVAAVPSTQQVASSVRPLHIKVKSLHQMIDGTISSPIKLPKPPCGVFDCLRLAACFIFRF